MNYMSFDIGILHLGMCTVDENMQILEWKMMTLPSKNIKDIIRLLKTDIDYTNIKCIFIERQPRINMKMQRISIIFETFFTIEHPSIKIKTIPAWQKWKWLNIEDTSSLSSYYKRKQCAIRICSELLLLDKNSSSWITFFNNQKKKDDLADSYLQIASYFKQFVDDRLHVS